MWIYGAGGFGRETLDACRAAGLDVEGFLDDGDVGGEVRGLPVRRPAEVEPAEFAVAIADPVARLELHHGMVDAGWAPVVVVDPRAVVGSETTIGDGSILLATAYVSTEVVLGVATHLNYGVTIGHDTVAGEAVTVLPGANVGGTVTIGDSVLVGANATVLQRLTIGREAVVGAGAVVTTHVERGTTVVGVPARPVES